jgi:hypothetical protein
MTALEWLHLIFLAAAYAAPPLYLVFRINRLARELEEERCRRQELWSDFHTHKWEAIEGLALLGLTKKPSEPARWEVGNERSSHP